MTSYTYLLSGTIGLLLAALFAGVAASAHPNAALDTMWCPQQARKFKSASILIGFIGFGLIVMAGTHQWIGREGLELVVLGASLMAACVALNEASTAEKNADSWGSLGCWTALVAVILMASGILQLLPVQT